MRFQKMLFPLGAAVLFAICFGTYCFVPRAAMPASAVVASSFTLIIDAGHGGEDGGAVSVSGQKESHINLSVAKKTEALAALSGVRTVMIRREDRSIHTIPSGSISQKKVSDLRQRVHIVNATPDAVLLSIHQNHFAQEKYRGAQVFYGTAPGSMALAEQIQEDLKAVLDPKNNRKVKPAKQVYLMKHANCTAVLVECGFLSNYVEDELLQNEDYQRKLAFAMLRAIVMQGNRGMENEV